MRISSSLLISAMFVASCALLGCSDRTQPGPAAAQVATTSASSDSPSTSDPTPTIARQTGAGAQDNHSTDSSNQTTTDMGKFQFKKQSFGKLSDGREASLYTITNPSGMQLQMTDYGATVVSLKVPDKKGDLANVCLTLPDAAAFQNNTAHYGATIGRFGNRIAKGKFVLDGKTYSLPINNAPNHLHGGPEGFDHQMWMAKEVEAPDARGLEFTYVSKDGEQGYPGTLKATATYWLTKDNALKIDYTATTEKDTVVNLTNHTYWNLAGAGSGDILGEQMMINADKYLAVDDTLIPTGKMDAVKGTDMDFTTLKQIGPGVAEIKKQGGRGYDHCYVLRSQDGKLALAAKAKDPVSGRVMEVWTDQPGIQFYTGNFLDGAAENGGYPQHSAFCLETQHYPDSPNQPEFPSTVLKPGQTFKSTTVYKFSTE
jgi:aldose 1-epimerase